MTVDEMHTAVNMLLDKINSMQADTILASEINSALDMAQLAFVKQRFQKVNKYGAGFEESQKRIDDLAPLVRTAAIMIDRKPYTNEDFTGATEIFPNASQLVLHSHEEGEMDLWRDVYRISVTDDSDEAEEDDATRIDPYMFLINVRARVWYLGCNRILEEGVDYELTNGVLGDGTQSLVVARRSFEEGPALKHKVVACKYAQNDDIFTMFKDPFNKPNLNGPFYSFSGADEINDSNNPASGLTNLEIYTDDTFFTDSIFIRYIKRPRKIGLNAAACELSDHVHIEIVNMAVDILLEGISDPRYKSHQMETLKSD